MIDKTFVLAGSAIFTVEIPAEFSNEFGCNEHYTFKVRFKEGTNGFKDAYFVSLLTGPDNTRDYTYLGMLNEHGGVHLTRKSQYAETTWPVRIIRRVLACIFQGKADMILAAGWDVHHEGRCGRCCAELTVPESIKSGFGPTCVKLVHATAS